MTLMRTVLVLAFVLALIPSPAAAQVDTWSVLHVGLQSGARADTDGDGRINSWYDCQPRGNSGKQKCKSLEASRLYQAWQTDVSCFPETVERWTGYQIDVVQDVVFIETDEPITTWSYGSLAWSHFATDYNFSAYDVVMVWTAYTQATGHNGAAWGPATGLGYGFVSIYGVSTSCGGWDGGIIPAHEFAHTVSALYQTQGFPVCPIYDYPYWNYGEEQGHTMILTNTFPVTTCSNGVISTGVPPEAWASGSYRDYYG
jgi:hypothetical protein